MEIIVIGGQPNENLEEYVINNIDMGMDNSLRSLTKKTSHNDGRKEDFSFLCFPERTSLRDPFIPPHPQTLLNRMINETNKCIKYNKSLYVLTFSDHVLNGVRVAIRENEKEVTAEVHQLHDNGEVTICPISKDGHIDIWEKDVFDVYDTSLDRLLFT